MASISSKISSKVQKAINTAKSVASKVSSNLSGQLGAVKSNLTASVGLAKPSQSSKGGLDYSQQSKIVNSPTVKLSNQVAAQQKASQQTAQNKIIQPYLSSPSYQAMARSSGNTSVGNQGGSQYSNPIGPVQRSGGGSSSSTQGGVSYNSPEAVAPRNVNLTNFGGTPGISQSVFTKGGQYVNNPNQGLIDSLTAQKGNLEALLKRQQIDSADQAVDNTAYTDQNENDYTDRLRSIEEELLKAQGPSGEETDVEGQLANLLASKEMGLQEIGSQPIAMGFITGQQSAVERRAATQSMPLQARLAQLQARRQSAVENARGRLGFAQEDVKRLTSQASENRKRQQEEDQYTQDNAFRYAQLGQNAINEQNQQALLQQKFQEDVRQFGIQQATRNYEAATSRLNANNKTTGGNPFQS